jgi:hypothetical protein
VGSRPLALVHRQLTRPSRPRPYRGRALATTSAAGLRNALTWPKSSSAAFLRATVAAVGVQGFGWTPFSLGLRPSWQQVAISE